MTSKTLKSDVSQISGALERWSSSISDLKNLGVVRSQKVLSDFSEWLVAEIYGGERPQSRAHPGYDVLAGSEKIQVKAHAKSQDNPNRWSTIKDPENFDTLALLILSTTYKVQEFYRISSKELHPYLKPYKQRYRLNWDDIVRWRIDKDKIPNFQRLASFFM
jgi:hypothetical protein